MGNRDDKTNMDEIKGRAKRAWGEATDSDDAREHGTVDKVSGKIKAGIETVREKAHDMLERNRDKD